MNRARRLFQTLDQALHILARGRRGLVRTGSLKALDDQIRIRAARNLRRAVGATITDLDINVIDDLMKIVKKLGKGVGHTSNGLEDRLKLTLELTQLALDRKAPPSPDQIIWTFNQIYKGLAWVMQQQQQAAHWAQQQGGM
jgi:hypothetical protein